MSDDALPPPANSYDEIAPVAKAFAQNVQAQIIEADKAGADDEDYCIVLPASYLALVFGMPLIYLTEEDEDGEEIGRRQVALYTKKGANALIQTLMRESGWAP